MGKKKNKNGGGGGGGGNQNQNQNQNQEPDKKSEAGGGEEVKEVVVAAEEKKEGGGGGGGGGGGNGGGGEKKKQEKQLLTVILKVEMHCEGCASKIIRLTRGFDGVESVKAEADANKLTVIGNVDPVQIRDKLHEKTRKKIELVSPQPKKEDNSKNSDAGKKNEKKPAADGEKKPDAAGEQKKPKETPVTTAVLKLGFHCQGCIEKIHKVVSKTKGVHEIVAMDKVKETVTVKGTMDVKALAEALKERLKRPVEIVPPPKKEKDAAGDKDKDKDKEKEGEKNNNNNNNNNNNGGGKKKKGGGGGDGEGGNGGGQGQENGGGGGMEVSRMEYMVQPGFMGQPIYGNGYVGQPVYNGNGYIGQPVYEYGYGPVPGYPVHMKFNDENPNACSVM